jgi:hypothetical protein
MHGAKGPTPLDEGAQDIFSTRQQNVRADLDKCEPLSMHAHEAQPNRNELMLTGGVVCGRAGPRSVISNVHTEEEINWHHWQSQGGAHFERAALDRWAGAVRSIATIVTGG